MPNDKSRRSAFLKSSHCTSVAHSVVHVLLLGSLWLGASSFTKPTSARRDCLLKANPSAEPWLQLLGCRHCWHPCEFSRCIDADGRWSLTPQGASLAKSLFISRHTFCTNAAATAMKPSLCAAMCKDADGEEMPAHSGFIDDAGLFPGVPEAYSAGVSKLATLLQDIDPATGLTHPLMLLRFLTFNDVPNAEAMVRDTVVWRKEVGVQSIMEEWGAQDVDLPWRRQPQTARARFSDRYFCVSRVSARTTSGGPLAVARLGRCDFDGVVREELVEVMIKQFIFVLEDVLQAGHAISVARKELVLGTVVIDVGGLPLSVVRYVGLVRRFATVMNSYFPDLVGTIAIVNAPAVFAQIWKLAPLFLDPGSLRKVQILGRNFQKDLEAKTDVKVNDLPAFLGGTRDDSEVPAAEKVPVGASAELRLLEKQ